MGNRGSNDQNPNRSRSFGGGQDNNYRGVQVKRENREELMVKELKDFFEEVYEPIINNTLSSLTNVYEQFLSGKMAKEDTISAASSVTNEGFEKFSKIIDQKNDEFTKRIAELSQRGDGAADTFDGRVVMKAFEEETKRYTDHMNEKIEKLRKAMEKVLSPKKGSHPG